MTNWAACVTSQFVCLGSYRMIFSSGRTWPRRKWLDCGGNPDDFVVDSGLSRIFFAKAQTDTLLCSSGGSTIFGGGLRSLIASSFIFVSHGIMSRGTDWLSGEMYSNSSAVAGREACTPLLCCRPSVFVNLLRLLLYSMLYNKSTADWSKWSLGPKAGGLVIDFRWRHVTWWQWRKRIVRWWRHAAAVSCKHYQRPTAAADRPTVTSLVHVCPRRPMTLLVSVCSVFACALHHCCVAAGHRS